MIRTKASAVGVSYSEIPPKVVMRPIVRLIEELVRTWIFEPLRDPDGTLVLTAETRSDEVDWESGANLRLECGQCFETFALPHGAKVKFG
jgi:hypothetical protein